MLWYQDLKQDGTNGAAAESGWHINSGLQIGFDWGNFKHVFSGGNGIIYAIRPTGELLWYRDVKQDGTNGSAAETGWDINSGNQIGFDWGKFKYVFSGGDGIIYAITPTGDLLWYQDLKQDGTNGAAAETGWHINSGSVLDTGFRGYRDSIYAMTGISSAFSGGNGVIYTVSYDQENGIITDSGSLHISKYANINGNISTLEQQGTAIGNGWRMLNMYSQKVQGYSDKLSVTPGETIEFKVSATCDYTLRYVRLESTGDDIGIPVSEDDFYEAFEQDVPEEPYKNGCDWDTSFWMQIPEDWQTGYYAAQLTDDELTSFYIVFIVKPTKVSENRIAIIANINTWNAYNDWGGGFKYSAPAKPLTSFERPNPHCSPQDDSRINHLTMAEIWVNTWLIQNDFNADVFTDYDFDMGLVNNSNYSLIILSTHPEYWTIRMLDNLEKYLGAGGNLIYIAGNGVFERAEIIGENKQLQFFDGTSTSRSPYYFRNLTPPRPERPVLGVAYRYDNYMTFAPFETLMDDHPFFEGTNLSNGDLFGQTGLNGPASGWEMDTSIAGEALEGSIVGAQLTDDRGYPPPNIQLLARGTNGTYGGDMTYYEPTEDSFVFSAGSISFGGSLVVDERLQIIMRNAIYNAIS